MKQVIGCLLLLMTTLYANFDSSLGVDRLGKEFFLKEARDAARYELLLQVWNELEHTPQEATIKIPKIIHTVWMREEAIPEEYKAHLQSWQKMHPNWQMRLWTLADLKSFADDIQDLFFRARSVEELEDMVRCVVLLEHGGASIDAAFECLKPIDQLHHTYNFYASLEPPLAKKEYGRHLHIATSFLACQPNHPIIKAWLDQIKILETMGAHLDKKIECALADSNARTASCYLLLGCAVEEHLVSSTLKNIVFPPTYLFPLRHNVIEQKKRAKKKSVFMEFIAKLLPGKEPLFSKIEPETIAVHCEGGKWQ